MHKQDIDLSPWRELRRFGASYLVWDEITRDAALFDPPPGLEALLGVLEAESLQLRHVFLTRDPGSLEALRARAPKFLLHTSLRGAPPQHRNRANDFIHLGSLRITNRGFGEEGVIYIIGNWPEDAPHVAILGDAAAIPEQAMREKVWSLPPETLLCPAGGEMTTVAASKR